MWSILTSSVGKIAVGMIVAGVTLLLWLLGVLDAEWAMLAAGAIASLTGVKFGHLIQAARKNGDSK